MTYTLYQKPNAGLHDGPVNPLYECAKPVGCAQGVPMEGAPLHTNNWCFTVRGCMDRSMSSPVCMDSSLCVSPSFWEGVPSRSVATAVNILQGPRNEYLGAECGPLDACVQPCPHGAALAESRACLQSMERVDLEHDQQSLAGTNQASQRFDPGEPPNPLSVPASTLQM